MEMREAGSEGQEDRERASGMQSVKVSPQGCSHPPSLWPLTLFHPEEKSVLEAFLPIGGGV